MHITEAYEANMIAESDVDVEENIDELRVWLENIYSADTKESAIELAVLSFIAGRVFQRAADNEESATVEVPMSKTMLVQFVQYLMAQNTDGESK